MKEIIISIAVLKNYSDSNFCKRNLYSKDPNALEKSIKEQATNLFQLLSFLKNSLQKIIASNDEDEVLNRIGCF